MRGAKAGAGLCACALAIAGCTSISWDDSDGVRHHFGLVAAQVFEEDGATRVRRWALGSDLDLARGGAWTLGLARSERVHVDESLVDDPRRMNEEYVAAMATDPAQPPASASWRFLWFSEEASPRAVLVERDVVGAAIAHGAELRGLYAGYAHGEAIDARVMGMDAAVYIQHRDGYRSRYRMWRLTGPGPEAEPHDR